MTLREHYKFRSSRKSIKPFIKLIIFVMLTLTVYATTFTRYASSTIGNSIVQVAKWSIKVNGQTITNENNSVPVSLLNKDDNTYNPYNVDIDSDDECYFDMIIDPRETEVAVKYSISADLSTSNLPTGTKITKYEKYIGTGTNETLTQTITVNNTRVETIEESVSLSNTQTALDESSIRKYRFYCKVPFPIAENAVIIQGTQFTVNPNVKVKQIVSE